MGLFDFLQNLNNPVSSFDKPQPMTGWDALGQLGLGMLQSSGPSPTPVRFGQVLAGGSQNLNNYKQTMYKQQQEYNDSQLKNKLLQLKMQQAAQGGQIPAPIQIVNEMQKAAQDAQNPALPPQQRELAKYRFSALNQVSKSYAIDRGMNPEMPDFGATQQSIPEQNAGQVPPMPPSNYGFGQGATTPPSLPMGQSTQGVTPIPGFANVAGGIAATKKGMETQAQKNVELQMNPQIQEATNRQGEVGSAQGKAIAALQDQSSQLPRLEQVVSQLSDLGKKATYTYAGQGVNALARQAGLPMSEGAIARREYMSKVDNEILPLLRQTFGAQFTEKEGQTLRNTLGDPNASPEEKDAVLRSFINQKRAQIGVLQSRTGQSPSVPQSSGVVDYTEYFK